MSGSKTTYHVSSTTFPLFDVDNRVSHYQAAMLDYTANSPIELSEYTKNYFTISKLRNYRGYLEWCKRSGFNNIFGTTSTSFYSNVKVNLDAVTEEIKKDFVLTPEESFRVYSANLNFFSEDFFVKHLATLAGKPELIYADSKVTYTIEYIDDKNIKATFSNGEVLTGTLPDLTDKTRFLEIEYSIITEKVVSKDPDPNLPPEESENVLITYKYGYIHYKEGSGRPVLDELIKKNSSKPRQSIYPVVPIRSNTAWFTGKQGAMVQDALKYLEIYTKKTNANRAYEELKDMCTNGMKQGSINDIDYITLVPSVSLNTTNKSDLRYLYEFFYNLYANEALSKGIAPSEVAKSKHLDKNSGHLRFFKNRVTTSWRNANFSTSYFYKFNLDNPSTNFHYTYEWGGADFFETNGQFKPGAKKGDYGVLSGRCTYSYYIYTLHREEYTVGDNDTVKYKYSWVRNDYSDTYTVTMFCHQYSDTRWHFTLFLDLRLINLVYAGKTIQTEAIDAINDAALKENITHNFARDTPNEPVSAQLEPSPYFIGSHSRPGPKPPDYFPDEYVFNLVCVKSQGENNTPFIVPLEEETFREVGYVNQANIIYGGQFLVFNCWVAKKTKWYQTGFFRIFALVVAVIVAVFSQQWYIIAAAWACAAVIAGAILIDLISKVLTTLLGDRIGGLIGGLLKSVYNMLCSALVIVFSKLCPPIAIGMAIGMAIVNVDENLQNGVSFGKSLFKGIGKTAINIGAAYVASQIQFEGFGEYNKMLTNAAQLGTEAGLNSFGTGLITGEGFKDALISGVVSGVVTAATYAMAETFKKISNTFKLLDGFEKQLNLINNSFNTPLNVGKDLTLSQIGNIVSSQASSVIAGMLTNPNTYINLIGAASHEVYIHRMCNLENDYQEFNNKAAELTKLYFAYNSLMSNTVTSEFICKLQTLLSRSMTISPEMALSYTPSAFLAMGTATGSDILKAPLGSITSYAESKLEMEGFTPYKLHYTQTDYSVLWDTN